MFLQNDDNKRQLFKLMLRVWTSQEAARRLVGRKVTLVVEGAILAVLNRWRSSSTSRN